MGFVPLVCTTPNGPTRPSAIAARGSFARYNPNSWLDIGGALQTFNAWPQETGGWLAMENDNVRGQGEKCQGDYC
jgi:hypothetical protein